MQGLRPTLLAAAAAVAGLAIGSAIAQPAADCYEADRADAPSDGSASKEGNCANRVFRSGTFLSNPYMQRSARRGAPYPATQRGRNYLGFRVAKTLD